MLEAHLDEPRSHGALDLVLQLEVDWQVLNAVALPSW